jgi:hypothetical protein
MQIPLESKVLAMILELTEQQRQLVKGQAGRPVEVVDPDTQRLYMLVARGQFEKVRAMLDEPLPDPAASSQPPVEIPAGIRRSQESFWRDLPEVLKQRKLRGQCACYSGDELIGISRNDAELIQRCLKRGIPRDEFYVGYIEESSTPPREPEEIEESLFEAVDS